MNNRRTIGPLTLAADTVTGLAIFLLLAGVLTSTCDGRGVYLSDLMAQAHAARLQSPEVSTSSWAQPTSHTIPLAMITRPPGQVFRGTDRATAFLVLGTVFTLLFVGNVALYRHLRAQYRHPRHRRRDARPTEL